MSLSNSPIAAAPIASTGVHLGSATISMDVGAYTYTGQSVTLDRPLPVAVGSYALTGQDVILFPIFGIERFRITAVDYRAEDFIAIDHRSKEMTAIDNRTTSMAGVDHRSKEISATDDRAASITINIGDRSL